MDRKGEVSSFFEHFIPYMVSFRVGFFVGFSGSTRENYLRKLRTKTLARLVKCCHSRGLLQDLAEASQKELDRRADRHAAALTQSLQEEQERDRASFADDAKLELAHRLAPEAGCPCFDQILRHHETYKNLLDDLGIDTEAGIDMLHEKEAEVVLLWMKMLMQVKLMERAISTKMDAFDSPFPITDSEEEVMLSEGDLLLHESGGLADASPDIHDLSDPMMDHEHRRMSIARYVVGNIGLLRQVLSRSRIIFPVGLPDAGKSTFLKKGYGIKCATGLDTSGRTPAITFYPHPKSKDGNYSLVLIADVPGFGDEIAARNDISRMILDLARRPAFRQCFTVFVFIPSGRPVKKEVRELTDKMDSEGIQYEYMITKVDQVYEQRVEDKHERFKEGQEGGANMKEHAARRELANGILRDDEEQVRGKPRNYLCLAGWAADSDDADKDDSGSEDDCLQPKYKFIKKCDVTARVVRQYVDSKIGLSAS